MKLLAARPQSVLSRHRAECQSNVRSCDLRPRSGLTATVESFGRRQASESLRCPNRGDRGLSYGASSFVLMVGRPDVAQKRTCAIADRGGLDRKSDSSKAEGTILDRQSIV